MRILVTVKPRMYREVLALSLHQHRPDSEVLISPPESLDGEVGRFRPHLAVYTEGAAPVALPSASYRVELLLSDSLDAEFSVDGQVTETKDVGMEELLTFVERAEKTIREEAAE